MLLLCISVLAFLYVQSSYGQQVYGEVQHDNCPIENCNVVVRNVVDSAFVSGATTDKSGFFAIDKMDSGSYFLEVSLVVQYRLFDILLLHTPLYLKNLKYLLLQT